MARKSRSQTGNATPKQRSAPSVARTIQALRSIRGGASRATPDAQMITPRGGRQLS